jgi:hypothetical protein
MNRISIISDRKDYHSVLVRDGVDIVELIGKRPWRTLFRAIVQLKLKQLKRRIHGESTKGKTDHTHPLASILPLSGYDQSTQPFHFMRNHITGTILPKPRLVLIQGQTVDELGAAASESRRSEKEEGAGGSGDKETNREPAA